MKRKYIFLILVLPLLILAAGCAPECEDEDYPTFEVLLDSPPFGELVNYKETITFDWHHNESCEPGQYRVKLTDLVSNQTTHLGIAEETEINFDGQWNWGDDFYLRANREYEWSVIAASVGLQTVSPPSQSWRFRTDGLCSAQELVPPDLYRPQNESWLGKIPPDNIRLIWTYPGDCFPEFYHYQLAADAEFNNIITSGITDFSDRICGESPGGCFSHYSTDLNHKIYDSLKISAPSCARVYWRVEARRGQASGGYSEVFRFTNAVDSSCWQNQQSIDAAILKGYVFSDYCKATVPYVPDGVGIAPPCVFGEPYGVHADGIRARVDSENEMTGEIDPAEPGIPGVVVDLGAGPCPSKGLDQFITVENGNYYFLVQSPGEYCVSIDKSNNPSLDHGIWTLPLTDQDVTQATITFNPGDDLIIQNFGWDQNDFLKIEFLVDLLSVCRAGPRPDYPEVAFVMDGDIIPVFARNQDATWFASLVDGKRCFISIASGEPAEDPDGLMIFPEQPEPVLVEEPPAPKECSDYKTFDACINHGCQWVYGAAGGICYKP